mmetsp:Transcript_6945/g.28494  ORF Transcript_6945/g.28494 Transcript_6945/m.28494 type:complete len:246 (-) Transcript_6945:1110-1847(-)
MPPLESTYCSRGTVPSFGVKPGATPEPARAFFFFFSSPTFSKRARRLASAVSSRFSFASKLSVTGPAAVGRACRSSSSSYSSRASTFSAASSLRTGSSPAAAASAPRLSRISSTRFTELTISSSRRFASTSVSCRARISAFAAAMRASRSLRPLPASADTEGVASMRFTKVVTLARTEFMYSSWTFRRSTPRRASRSSRRSRHSCVSSCNAATMDLARLPSGDGSYAAEVSPGASSASMPARDVE